MENTIFLSSPLNNAIVQALDRQDEYQSTNSRVATMLDSSQ